MKERIEDISADIELQYGQRNMERNIAYVLSLAEARVRDDGELDDNIPVPSVEAAAKTILLLLDRPELSWETICREQLDPIELKHAYNEVNDIAEGAYDLKIDNAQQGLQR